MKTPEEWTDKLLFENRIADALIPWVEEIQKDALASQSTKLAQLKTRNKCLQADKERLYAEKSRLRLHVQVLREALKEQVNVLPMAMCDGDAYVKSISDYVPAEMAKSLATNLRYVTTNSSREWSPSTKQSVEESLTAYESLRSQSEAPAVPQPNTPTPTPHDSLSS